MACEHFCSRTHNGINVMMLRMNEKLSSDSVSTCFHAQHQVVVYKKVNINQNLTHPFISSKKRCLHHNSKTWKCCIRYLEISIQGKHDHGINLIIDTSHKQTSYNLCQLRDIFYIYTDLDRFLSLECVKIFMYNLENGSTPKY